MFIIARKLGVKLGVNLPRDFKYLSMDLRKKEIFFSPRGIACSHGAGKHQEDAKIYSKMAG